jgi:hypothetical protein
MTAARRIVGTICVLGLLLGVTASRGNNVAARDSTRHTTIITPYTEYEWWMMHWSNNEVGCQILIEHEGLPTIEEVTNSCGVDLADEWWNTPRCNADSVTQCSGVYLYLASTQPKEKEVAVELPPSTAWVELEGCTPVEPNNLCTVLPVLVITGDEPLTDQKIIGVQGIYDTEPFYCEGEICKIPLRATPLQGVNVDFWVDSSYGDSSEHFNAQVRVVDTGVSPQPGGGGWYVDVVSSQWRGTPLASCARIWEAFPPIGTPPNWLATPDRFELLATEEPYYYLAGRLISQGLVDASECASSGLLPNGYADVCGLEKARPIVEEWQNQFDNRIIEVSKETGVPAQLMKNLFAQESQFWPGMYRVPFEFGLGQITERGTDTILIWNPTFFQQFCPMILSEETCAGGYLDLSQQNQSIIRGALALQARADCKDCPEGIDLTDVNFTVSLFANTLLANCAQISRSVYTATGMMAGRVATYEDLWRFTIANYHAGAGCVSFAIHQAWGFTEQLTWQEASTRFTEPCNGVVPYVEQITR